MLTLREEQLTALGVDYFEREMLAHLQDYAPVLFELRGASAFRKIIRDGVNRAESYGLTQRGPIRLFIELMVSLGHRFDSDPQFPWAERILMNSQELAQMDRAQQLYDDAIHFTDVTVGPDNEYALLALRHLAQREYYWPEFAVGGIQEQVLRSFAEAYPERADYIGSDQLGKLIDEAVTRARGWGMESVRSHALFAALFFSFGHGIDSDPLYPWVRDALSSRRYVTEEQRIAKLERRSRRYMLEVLSTLST